MTFSKKQIEGMQDFIWGSFTDYVGSGVALEDVLTGAKFAGVKLTKKQIESVISHESAPDEWTEADEEVRDLIADATADCEDGDKLFKWLEWIVGDEAYEIVDEVGFVPEA